MQGVNSLEKDVEAFLGIPYAEPPIGNKRFSKPIAKKNWQSVYSASKLPPPCVQSSFYPYYFMPDTANMSEDCLYLNIWVPKENDEEESRPVVIFFHSGAFVTGASNQKTYDGSHLASRGDLVVVTINYRLGALGFFLAYTDEANGNMGMYDQLMAIKWVKTNAKQFSADPDKLVLMGVSAGAFSVSNHIASPLSNHLFKRAIIESGTSLNPAFMKNDKLFESSQKLAAQIGCTNRTITLKNNPQSVVRCLKNKPKEAFADAEKVLLSANPLLFYPRNNDEFLPRRIVDVLRGGQFGRKIDLLCGVTEDEGSMMMITGLRDYFGYYGRKQENKMNKFRAVAFSRGAILVSGQPNLSGIVDIYLNNLKNRTSVEYTKMVANLIGDFSISCGTIFLADFVSLGGNSVYFYKFDYRTSSTPMAEWVGATHLDEVQYVFGNPYHQNFTTQETELSHLLIDRWSAFAKTGFVFFICLFFLIHEFVIYRIIKPSRQVK